MDAVQVAIQVTGRPTENPGEDEMADSEELPPLGQPVTLFDEINRDELEREIAQRVSNRFSVKALRAALYPRHLGKMDQPDGYARAHGWCGDLMTFYLRIEDGRIPEITFTTDGCDATIASGEMLASMVTGMSLEEVEQVTPDDLLTALDGLPLNHAHCAELAVATLRAAIAGYRKARKSRIPESPHPGSPHHELRRHS
jgi:nitrogen fixation NifU-like protein